MQRGARSESLEAEVLAAERERLDLATRLSASRLEAARRLEEEVGQELGLVGLPL
jgi:DNA repair ATPase RecN